MTDDNMKLWDAVCETDPDTTKKVNSRGGFTAICAQSQLQKATEIWGSYGSTWGVKELQFEYMPSDKPTEAILHGLFVYPGGSFQISTDATYKPGNDTCKKLLTDLTTKALSKLGFNADVFLGKFDDNKYVAEVTAKYKKDPNSKHQKYKDRAQALSDDMDKELRVCQSDADIDGVMKDYLQYIKQLDGINASLIKDMVTSYREQFKLSDDEKLQQGLT